MTTSDVLTYFKNKIKIINKVIKDKIILQKFIHTNIKGLLDERHGECVKEYINVFLSKARSIFG